MGSNSVFGSTGGVLVGSNESLYPGSIVTVASKAEIKNLILVGCSRQQSVDLQIVKALSGDFALNVFGDQPVYMELQGIQPITSEECASLNTGSQATINEAVKTPIEKWYNTIKLGTKTTEKLSIAVNGEAFSGYAYKLMTHPQSATTGGFNYRLWIVALPVNAAS